MFAKLSTVVFALLAITAQVAVATPPACVIAAVNTQSDPSDFKSICGSSVVKKYLSDNCGDNLKVAQSAFQQTCKDAGVTVSDSSDSDSSSSASKSDSASATASHSSSGSHASATGDSSESSAPSSASSSGSIPSQPTETGLSATSTGGAAGLRVGMDIVGLLGLGVAGAMLAL